MAKTKVTGGYIADAAITSDHLHTTLDLSSKTLTIGATTVSGHLIPDTNITYDLGSSTYRFRDIYLDGNTIDLGGTELKKNDAGDIEFKSGSNFKKLVISELEFDDGSNRKKFKIDGGKIKTFDSSGASDTADKISLAANKTDDLGEGTTNLYFTNERVDDRVNSLLTAGTGITLTYDDANNTLTIAGSAQYGDSDARSAISVSGNALSYNSSTGVITANYEESPTFTGTVTSGAILSTQAGNNDIEVRSVGDYFPSLTIARTGGTTKTNYEWNLQIGSDGYLNFKDITNGYYPLIFRNNGDVYLGNNTSAASPVLLLDQSAASATFSGNIVVSGTVDGRDIATDGTKLDGIESGATADQTQSDINALGITAIGLSGTPNITVGTIDSGTITTTGDLDLTGTSDTADEKIILPRGGHIAFYGNGSLDHAISSMGTDDIRINSYGEIILNLDSNNNNTVDANFRIVKHGGGSSAGTAVFSVDGENGNVTATGTLQATSFSDGTISGITFIDEDSFATNSATRVPTQQSIKAYVDAQVAGVVDSAPAALNTLNELAAALGDDANFATTTSTALGNRLRVDTAAQGLTGTQQDNAITNLGITATKAELNVLDGITATVTELNYTDGVTSNIQTQLNAKLTNSSGLNATNLTSGTVALARLPAVLSPSNATELGSGTDLNTLTASSAGFYYQTANADTTGNNYPSNEAGSLIVQKSAGQATQLYQTYTSSPPKLFFRSNYTTGYGTWERVFSDSYHPNADTWTTARTISLGGDLTGNVSINGSADVTLTAAVVDDSHNHIISNVDGLQAALDAKYGSGSNVSLGTISSGAITSTAITSSGGVQGTGLAVNNTSGTTKWGLALYGGSGSTTNPTYGLMFSGTSGSGTHGSVTGDWATYFTMNNSTGRGWIFRNQSTPSNVASISNTGNATFDGTITASGGNSGNWNTAYGWGNHASAGYLASSSYTASDVLTKIKTVDGSGSGLDADTVDGIEASSFARTSAIASINMNNYAITNLNDLSFNDPGPNEGLRWIGGSDWRIYESPDDLTTNSGGNLQFTTGGTRRATLNTSGSLWTSGQGTLWGASNDGSGSGLDADLLDGQHGSHYLDYNNFTNRPTLASSGTNPNQLYIYNTNPTIYFRDTDHLPAMLHNNSNLFYILRGNSNATTTWTTFDGTGGASGWPLVINLTNSGHYFNIGSPNVNAAGNKVWHAGNDGSGSGLDADTLDGYAPSESAAANSIVKREGSGHIYGNYILGSYFNASSGNSENPTIGQIWTQSTGDNYLRKSTPAHLISQLGLFTTSNDGSGSGLDADLLDGSNWTDYKATGASVLNVQAGDGNGIRFWSGSTSYNIYMSQNGASGAGLIPGLSAQDYNMYFRMSGGTNRGFAFQSSTGTPHSGIDASGNSSFYTVIANKYLSSISSPRWDNSFYVLQSQHWYGQNSSQMMYLGESGNSVSIRGNTYITNGAIYWDSTTAASLGGFVDRHTAGLNTDIYPSPIYSIGTSYRPSGTGLSNHYGCGYAHTNASFYSLSGQSGWGFYVSSDGAARVQLGGSNGTISCTGNVVAYASDGRLKTNVKPIENALEKVMKIRGVEYDWVDNIETEYEFFPTSMHEVGVIAQEVEEVLPEVIREAPFNSLYTAKLGRRKYLEQQKELGRELTEHEAKVEFEALTKEEMNELSTNHNYLTVDYERMSALLIEAIKEQQTLIQKQSKLIENLEERLIKLEK